MKKKTLLTTLILLIFSLLVLAACGGAKLSDSFKEDELKSAAEKTISLINGHNSKDLREMGTVQLKDALTDEVMQKVFASIDEGGKFEKIEEMSFAGKKDKETEQEFAIVVAKAKYENRSFIYTLSFTKQLKLAGLFYK
ncbi:MAG: DUF3887 domain-containing protein [Anaerolineaceae bacterium]|nr:DUF3887 domain-containing protein [Anaerolineaceae bacterium]